MMDGWQLDKLGWIEAMLYPMRHPIHHSLGQPLVHHLFAISLLFIYPLNFILFLDNHIVNIIFAQINMMNMLFYLFKF